MDSIKTRSTLNDQALLVKLNALVAHKASHWYGSEAILSSGPVTEQRSWSYILQYNIRISSSKSVKIFAKISRRPEITALEQAIRHDALRCKTSEEYNNMLVVQNVFRSHADVFCYVKPLAYLDEFNAIVMEELPSLPLKKWLLRPKISLGVESDWRYLLHSFSLAGQWLSIYHRKVGSPEIEPVNLQEMEKFALHEFNRLQARIQGQLDLSYLRNAIRKMIYEFRKKHPVCKTTTLHGDFNCANVLIDNRGRIGALDAGCKRGVIYEDLAKFMTDLATRREQVLTHGALIRPVQLDRIWAAIFKGYFDYQPIQQDLLKFYSVTTIMRKWVSNEERLDHRHKYPYWLNVILKIRMRAYFQRLVRYYL